MGRNSKRTLLGTIALVMLFALTAYAADITFRFHIADEGVGYNSTAAHKEAYQYVVNIIVDDISRDSVLYQKKNRKKYGVLVMYFKYDMCYKIIKKLETRDYRREGESNGK